MQFNPYSNVKNLPQNNIAGLMSGAGQSMDRMRTSGLGAIDALRGVGIANENELYNAKLAELQNSPEFLSANPMQRQVMVQSAGAGLELDPQNIRAQEQLFKTLGDEQRDLTAMERLGIDIGARQSEADTGRKFTAGESEKGRVFTSSEAEKVAKAREKESASERLFRTNLQDDLQNFQMHQQENQQNFLAGENLKKLLAEAGREKETTLSNIGAKGINAETIDKAVKDTQEYISDNEDLFFDRKLDKQSRQLADEAITRFTSSPRGQEMIARGARPQEIWNELSKTFSTQDTFDITNILPFGEEMFQKRLIPKQ